MLPAARFAFCDHCGLYRPVAAETVTGHLCADCLNRCPTCDHCGVHAPRLYSASLDFGSPSNFCADCADLFAPCEHCGNAMPHGALTEARDRYGATTTVCPDCFAKDYAQCDCCAEYYPTESLTTVSDGSLVCEDCLSDSYFFCDHCEEWHEESAACNVHNSDGETIYVCEDCRDRHFTRCDDCGAYYPDGDMQRTEDGNYICPECRESGNYAYCERCGDLCYIDNVEYIEETDGYLCHYCAETYERENGCGDLLHEYSYKPKNTFFRTDADTPGAALYFGVELELSHSDTCTRKENFRACHDILNPGEEEENIYTKTDSTLNNGFEIVSHPRTLSSWHAFAPTLQEYFDQAAEYTRGDRDGLHVHISRRGMSEAHMLRFSAFINAVQDELMPIARRRSEWGAYADHPKTAGDCKSIRHHQSRYSAVNWRNSSTVELRIFRATIDLREFMAAVEFAHAAYQFTKYCTTMQILRGDPWALFLSFIASYPQKYANLIGLLRDAYSNPEASKPEFFAALGKEKRRAA